MIISDSDILDGTKNPCNWNVTEGWSGLITIGPPPPTANLVERESLTVAQNGGLKWLGLGLIGLVLLGSRGRG